MMTIPDEAPPPLKPCPFCNHATAAKVVAASELFGSEDEFYEHAESYAVVCDAASPNGPGGCGGQGGFAPTSVEAVAKWNARASEASHKVAAAPGTVRDRLPRLYSLDHDPDGIRRRAADAITGALAFGTQGANKPPPGHWLEPFWNAARADATMLAAAPSAPALGERTPKDCAIEHAEYMAQDGERLIVAVNDLARAEQEREDGQCEGSDVDAARETLTEAVRAMESGVYEFRKRRDRASAPQPAQAAPEGVTLLNHISDGKGGILERFPEQAEPVAAQNKPAASDNAAYLSDRVKTAGELTDEEATTLIKKVSTLVGADEWSWGMVHATTLARAFAAALSAPVQQAAGVPEGWKLVPLVPTPAMVNAATRLDLSYMPLQENADRIAVYRAMLASSPDGQGAG